MYIVVRSIKSLNARIVSFIIYPNNQNSEARASLAWVY